jgi:hypothetical protein
MSTASPILSNTWCSRGPSTARPRRSPARSIPSAATWTPSPPRNASASTSRCSTNTFPVALDILSDLVLHPVFDAAEDIARERGVILEEIKMDEDNPDYLVHEIFTQNFWKDHPLGKPILGTKETGEALRAEAVSRPYYSPLRSRQHHRIRRRQSRSRPNFVDLVPKHFEHLKPVAERLPRPAAQDRLPHHAAQQESSRAGATLHRRSGVSHCHEKRHAGYILNTLLGGGMSSRLFQNVRESARAWPTPSTATSIPTAIPDALAVYAGTSLASAPKVVQSVVSEFRELKTQPVPEEELKRSKDQLKGSLMLRWNRARPACRTWRARKCTSTTSRISTNSSRRSKPSPPTISESGQEFFKTESVAVTALGNLSGLKISRDQLAC